MEQDQDEKVLIKVKETQALDRIKDTLSNLDKMHNEQVIPEQIYSNIRNSFEFCLKAYKHLRYRYILTGVISSGKTSLINALVGKFILQTSIMQCTQWPIIIRHQESDVPKLFAAKINEEFEFEFEEDELIAEGIDHVTENIVKINSNKKLFESFNEIVQRMEKEEAIEQQNLSNEEFSKFVFILKININFTKFLVNSENKDRLEIWDLPGMNDKNDKFNKLLVRKFLSQEEKLRDNLSLFHTQRMFFVYISDFACLNQSQVFNLWESFEGLRIYCEKVLFIVNKIDQFNFSNVLLFFKKEVPQELASCVKRQYLEHIGSNSDEHCIEISDIQDLEKLYNKLPKSYKAKVITMCKGILTKTIKSLFDREHLFIEEKSNKVIFAPQEKELEDLYPNEFFNVATVSSLQALLEDYMKRNSLDDTFWRVQHYLFNNNQELQTVFPDFAYYKFYLQNVIKDSRMSTDFWSEFESFEKKLAVFVDEANIAQKIVLSYNEIVKNSVIGINKVDGLMSSSFIENAGSRSISSSSFEHSKSMEKKDHKLFSSFFGGSSGKLSLKLSTPDIIDLGKHSLDLEYSVKELKNLLDLFFNDLQANVNELVYSIKSQIDVVFNEKQLKIKEYINSIVIFNSEKFNNVGKYYDEIAKEIYQIKEFTNQKFLKNKKDLIENLETDIESLSINSFVIRFYIKEIDQIMDFELLRFHDNFANSDIHFFTSLGVGVGAGMISFLLANAFRTFGTAAISEVSGSTVSGGAFGPVGLIVGFLVGTIAFAGTTYYYNNKNKNELIEKEKELWEKILLFKQEILQIVDNFKTSIEKSIENKREKINCFMKFLSSVFK